ncbi:alkaline shock response membrane anchor protein AmaP [Actinomadura flavalba]|uniref:alkaline shock response membrane anchor protein AmaP n=1 Tax=Actinomadura flavalba TaxID=1120938 RepID=UPI00037D610B|nr:alkaline shock response membrane anchor protein AmaP [Actinomadura flavalba]
MDRHAARLNRTALTLLGLVLLLAGLAGLALGLGLFGAGRADEAVLSDATRRFASGNAWYWYAVAAGAVVLALLGLGWLIAQGRRDKVSDLALEPDPGNGTTKLSAKAVTNALEDEIEEYPGVRGAGARLGGSSARPKLFINVAYARDADLAGLRRRVTGDALAHVRTALDRDSLPAVVRLKLVTGAEEPRTVH